MNTGLLPITGQQNRALTATIRTQMDATPYLMKRLRR